MSSSRCHPLVLKHCSLRLGCSLAYLNCRLCLDHRFHEQLCSIRLACLQLLGCQCQPYV